MVILRKMELVFSRRTLLFVMLMIMVFSNGEAKEINIVKNMEVEGLIEVEALHQEAYDGKIKTDIYLKTFEPKIKIGINRSVTGNVTFLYEEDRESSSANDNFLFDEGYLTYGNFPENYFFINGGKKYVPFGNYENPFATDPLTLEFGET